MAEQERSVLARKISANAAKAEAFPDLAPFAEAIGKAAGETASDLLAGDFVASASARLSPLPDLLAGRAEPSFYYWLLDGQRALSALIIVSPAFASAVTARLLGGELSIAPEDARPSAMDFGMAFSLVDLLTPALGEVLAKRAPSFRGRPFVEKRSGRSAKEVLKDREALSVFAIEVALALGDAKADGALTIAFPAPLLDKAGLMRRARAAAPDPASSRSWSERMRRNVLATEIPLAVVLDRYITNIGELSRLEIGKIIDLRADALQRLDLTATTTGGPETVATARLGAYHGRKAVKLSGPIDPDFIKGLAEA